MAQHDCLGGVAAVLLVAVFALAPPAMALTPEDAPVTARLAIALRDKVGPRAAGVLCFPNGALRMRDFVTSAPELAAMVQEELAQSAVRPAVARQALRVELVALHAKLCARDYGVVGRGDRQGLSGEAAFTFVWQAGDAATAPAITVPITITVSRDQAVPPPALLGQAVAKLVARMTAAEAKAGAR